MATATAMPDDLYECYLLFHEEMGKKMATVITNQKTRNSFLRTHKPISRKTFERALKRMTPEHRKDYEKRLRTPYKQRYEESMLVAKKARQEYQTDPKVRERVGKEIKRALKKGLTSRRG